MNAYSSTQMYHPEPRLTAIYYQGKVAYLLNGLSLNNHLSNGKFSTNLRAWNKRENLEDPYTRENDPLIQIFTLPYNK